MPAMSASSSNSSEYPSHTTSLRSLELIVTAPRALLLRVLAAPVIFLSAIQTRELARTPTAAEPARQAASRGAASIVARAALVVVLVEGDLDALIAVTITRAAAPVPIRLAAHRAAQRQHQHRQESASARRVLRLHDDHPSVATIQCR